ncbi:MAG: 6-phosphogluconate dehydrogenase [marine bacterium B5-7]|nr:MAG: 6-phosphogluconate dehydrogenase [marine bacterium B5-7]
MQIGMIGLGRMGSNMVRRLTQGSHECVVYDVNTDAVHELALPDVIGTTSLEDMVGQLAKPRKIWMMIPAVLVDRVLAQLAPLLEEDDVVIDGSNSHYHDDIRRSNELKNQGIHYLDVGTSGGISGLEHGYCLMIGGEKSIAQQLTPIFATLSPGIDAAPSTPGRKPDTNTAEQGYLHCGPHGAGHFVKMVHNGIEYGVMAAYAEGLNILHNANIGKQTHDMDAETTPLRNPGYYQYDFDLPEIAEVWRRGSVVRSWLLDLTASALLSDPKLDNFSGRVSDSGEGRWTLEAAIDEAVPVPVLSAALYERFSSRGDADFANKILSAMRHEFGGHIEKKT